MCLHVEGGNAVSRRWTKCGRTGKPTREFLRRDGSIPEDELEGAAAVQAGRERGVGHAGRRVRERRPARRGRGVGRAGARRQPTEAIVVAWPREEPRRPGGGPGGLGRSARFLPRRGGADDPPEAGSRDRVRAATERGGVSWLTCPVQRFGTGSTDRSRDDVEAAIERLARSDDVRHVAVMPDVHLAADVCVGMVVATRERSLPERCRWRHRMRGRGHRLRRRSSACWTTSGPRRRSSPGCTASVPLIRHCGSVRPSASREPSMPLA